MPPITADEVGALLTKACAWRGVVDFFTLLIKIVELHFKMKISACKEIILGKH